MSRSELTDTLFGYTCTKHIEFTTDLNDGVCVLTLELSRNPECQNDMVRAEFIGVAQLSIQNIGGGISQILLLIIEDISEEGLDRISYRVHDAESDSISFMCRSIKVKGADGTKE